MARVAIRLCAAARRCGGRSSMALDAARVLVLIALFLCWLWAALMLHTTLIVALALAIVVIEVA